MAYHVEPHGHVAAQMAEARLADFYADVGMMPACAAASGRKSLSSSSDDDYHDAADGRP